MTTITTVFDPPLVTDPTPTFNTKAFALAAALNAWSGQVNTVAGEVNAFASTASSAASTASSAATTATNAAASATASAASAINAPGSNATSTTSLTISLASLSFTIQTGKLFSVGQQVVLASAANPGTNYMQGIITAHNNVTGSMTVNVTVTNGSGTYADWVISLTAIASITPSSAQTLTNKTLAAYFEVATAVPANNLDLATGSVFTKTITANTTLTLSNLPAAGKCQSLTLLITNGGAFTTTLWSGVKWSGGVPPTLTAAGLDILEFFTIDGGATWYASRSAKDIK